MLGSSEVYFCLTRKCLVKFSVDPTSKSSSYDIVMNIKNGIEEYRQIDEIFIGILSGDKRVMVIDQFSKAIICIVEMSNFKVNQLIWGPSFDLFTYPLAIF
jgi:hypothetical protein